MPEKHQPLFSTAYLRSVWAREYEEFKNSPEADILLTRLSHWAAKHRHKETAAEAAFIAAQWRHKVRQTNITGKFDGKRLLNMLLKLRKTNNPAIPRQVVQIDAEMQTLDEEIATAEAQMNALTYRLYKLTPEEIRMVEQG